MNKTNFFHSVSRWSKPGCPNDELQEFILSNIEKSTSQLQQDLLAQFIYERKPVSNPGFFVEFGATDGISLSNTFILEKYHGWNGILAEPSRKNRIALAKNRGCLIDFRCVYSVTGEELAFTEMEIGEHSSISGFSRTPGKMNGDVIRDHYSVTTITLEDLLDQHEAPNFIDFLSIDTEGSEWQILKDFNFEKYNFGFIAIELSQNIDGINELMSSNGYVKILTSFSGWDGWYVSPSYAELLT